MAATVITPPGRAPRVYFGAPLHDKCCHIFYCAPATRCQRRCAVFFVNLQKRVEKIALRASRCKERTLQPFLSGMLVLLLALLSLPTLPLKSSSIQLPLLELRLWWTAFSVPEDESAVKYEAGEPAQCSQNTTAATLVKPCTNTGTSYSTQLNRRREI